MIGESVPLKTLSSKTKADWLLTGEVIYVDMGNGFTLIKFSNEMDCNYAFFGQPWFVQEQILNLQRWRGDFDPFKECIKSIIVWIRLPSLPLELWGEFILRKLLKQVGYVIKIDPDSEDVYKGRFARVCVEVDISKALKMEIKYKRGNSIKSALIDYENLTDICYGCGQQDHQFENCPSFPKSFSIKIEKRLTDSICPNQVPSQNNQDLPMANDNWVEIKPKRRQGPSMGKPHQGIPKNLNASTTNNEIKGRA